MSVVVAARNEGDEPYTLGAMVGGVSTADGSMRIQNFTRSVSVAGVNSTANATRTPRSSHRLLAPPCSQKTPHKTQLIGEELLPGQETSVEYNFYLNPILAGRDFGVAVALLYTGKADAKAAKDGEAPPPPPQFVAVAFNQTVDVVEPPRLVDTEAIFMFAVLGALGLGVLYFAWAVMAERLGLPAPSAVLGLDGPAGGAKGGAGAAAAAAAAAAAKKAAAKSAVDDDEWVKGTSYDLAAKRKRQQAATARVR